MTAQQLVLSLVLATMVFSVALELKMADFRRVAQTPKAVVCGLIPQFILLPVGTWAATLALDLPPNVEAAMILVAACPGGSVSNVITHFGRGNTARRRIERSAPTRTIEWFQPSRSTGVTGRSARRGTARTRAVAPPPR